MKFSIKGLKKGDFLLEMTAWASLTVIESRHKFVLVSRSRGRR